jgi:hypothetical protein
VDITTQDNFVAVIAEKDAEGRGPPPPVESAVTLLTFANRCPVNVSYRFGE